jgi:hypothetical protein
MPTAVLMMALSLSLPARAVRAQQAAPKPAGSTAAATGKPAATPQAAAASVQASPGPGSSPSPDTAKKKYVRGWLARIMPVGTDASVVPPDELGRFIATKDSYRLGDFAKESSIRTGADVGWKGEGYLDVTAVGRHTFSMNFTLKATSTGFGTEHARCWGSILVESQVVAQGKTALNSDSPTAPDIKSVVGGADLEPGRYRVEFWAACGVEKNEVIAATADNTALRSAMNTTFEVLLKRPNDAEPVSASKALILKLQKDPPRQKSP